VEAEHCKSPDSHVEFRTTNYGITTTPAKEWEITMKRDTSRADMRHKRRLPDVEELHRSNEAQKAGLSLIEVIVLVLYTGPMVRPLAIPHTRRCPPNHGAALQIRGLEIHTDSGHIGVHP
jgi:hypothetical protein